MNKTTTTRPELSFDGFGINGPDDHRTRIATFSNGADKYGNLFAAAPELLASLEIFLRHCDAEWITAGSKGEHRSAVQVLYRRARAAVEKAKGAAQ